MFGRNGLAARGPLRVLVIEGDEPLLALLCLTLCKDGLTTEKAVSATEGLSAVEHRGANQGARSGRRSVLDITLRACHPAPWCIQGMYMTPKVQGAGGVE